MLRKVTLLRLLCYCPVFNQKAMGKIFNIMMYERSTAVIRRLEALEIEGLAAIWATGCKQLV